MHAFFWQVVLFRTAYACEQNQDKLFKNVLQCNKHMGERDMATLLKALLKYE